MKPRRRAPAQQGSDGVSTVRVALNWGIDRLRRAGVAEAEHHAATLLGQVFGRPRLELPLYYGSPLDGAQLAAYGHLVERRVRREPLQYILGLEGFMGLDFAVDSRALIPRPETELLAERALAIAREFGSGVGGPPTASLRIADIGTGTGCLAITLAKALPRARLWAIDRSEAALALARENAARHAVTDRVEFRAGDYLQPLISRALSMEMIVSNPPYIPSAEIHSLQEEVRDFEPRSALDGGPDGLDAYRALAAQAPQILTRPGWLAVEIGAGQDAAVAELLRAAGFEAVEVHPDLAGISRVITARLGPAKS